MFFNKLYEEGLRSNLFGQIKSFLIDRFTGRRAKEFPVTDEVLTWANGVTGVGIAFVIVRAMVVLAGGYALWIPVLQVFAAISDACDGIAADALDKRHTQLGKVMDPFRDRLDAAVTLFTVWWLWGEITMPCIITIVAAEIIIIMNSFTAWLRQSKSYVHWIGKFRMAVYQVCSFAVVVQAYWFGKESFINALPFLEMMTYASLAAMVGYVLFQGEKE